MGKLEDEAICILTKLRIEKENKDLNEYKKQYCEILKNID